jgi:hypothetical protein
MMKTLTSRLLLLAIAAVMPLAAMAQQAELASRTTGLGDVELPLLRAVVAFHQMQQTGEELWRARLDLAGAAADFAARRELFLNRIVEGVSRNQTAGDDCAEDLRKFSAAVVGKVVDSLRDTLYREDGSLQPEMLQRADATLGSYDWQILLAGEIRFILPKTKAFGSGEASRECPLPRVTVPLNFCLTHGEKCEKIKRQILLENLDFQLDPPTLDDYLATLPVGPSAE